LVVGALPKRTESAGGTDDGQVIDVIASGNFAQLVGHASATGDARDHPAGLFQHAFENLLGAAHLPKNVDIDRALAAGDVIGPANLLNCAIDGVADKLFVPVESRQLLINLRNDATFSVVAVGIYSADSTDSP